MTEEKCVFRAHPVFTKKETQKKKLYCLSESDSKAATPPVIENKKGNLTAKFGSDIYSYKSKVGWKKNN